MNNKGKMNENSKNEQLEQFRVRDEGEKLTTNQGLKVSEDEFSLKAGERGPTLMEDFHFREKMTHFDHERIPERIVHARGFAAHGEFEVYESMKKYTKAKFLQDPSVKTPVFVRFSTVAGSRGSAETVRDVRGFATKFYTEEGNYDLVGNNIPVFFIQDAIKFPDLIHAVKPEPHNEIPQAASAHDTFWDFVANNQESAHMVMWHLSDRAIPRSFRMMEGFGVHTFRLVNEEGKAHFVKFHWKPVLGVHSLVWDEAQKIAGKDPDFHRRDLWESIEGGLFPEYELGVQLIAEEDEFSFDFDVLDPTKLWPEEDVPVKIIGKMTLNRNVDNVFAETEQVAFHPGHVVPGIDFTNDPLLQGRLFSYTDTQLLRLGGPNFHELPINRPVCPFHNNQRDGFGRQTINVGQVSYHKNSLASNTPAPVSEDEGGYVHYQEKVEGRKVQSRSESFKDHFSQAAMFWNSMSEPEKEHIIDAFSFELGKVKSKSVQQQVVDMFANVSVELATAFALAIGAMPPQKGGSQVTKSSPALSQLNTKKLPNTRKVGVIIGTDFKGEDVLNVCNALIAEGIQVEVISDKLGNQKAFDGTELKVDHTFLTCDSVLFDAIYAAGGKGVSQKFKEEAAYFIQEAFSHYKAIGATFEGKNWLQEEVMANSPGVVIEDQDMSVFAQNFGQAISAHRHWNRQLVK
ncbi:catalase [Metabacillus sediminilitoris]|uniref:Catalase n=1 Tax=Metabacillus sediminilitoris TaxID=2567941 RepID=A0A4V3WF01_9BACI|nr:catalase [Metabacillus sediminilitoris]QGQ48492.1 catalase [Metabacillus sediminilitoris]THF77880.1 catalase [Metabacillus sediminilitoris]